MKNLGQVEHPEATTVVSSLSPPHSKTKPVPQSYSVFLHLSSQLVFTTVPKEGLSERAHFSDGKIEHTRGGIDKKRPAVTVSQPSSSKD